MGKIAQPREAGQVFAGRRRSRWVTILACTTGYAGYYLCNCLFLLLSLPAIVLLAPFPTSRCVLFQRSASWFSRWLTQFYLPLLGVSRIASLSGMENCPTDRPYICVSNHRGRLDPLLLTGLLRKTSVLIKAKHARFPMLAYLVRFCGYASIDPSSASGMVAALQKCAAMLSSGFNLLVFPEGTRAAGERLRRFGKFAFEMAVKQNVPVVPVVIYSRTGFMVKSLASFYPDYRVDYHIAFLPPIYLEPDDTPDTISDKAYRSMSRELASMIRDCREGVPRE